MIGSEEKIKAFKFIHEEFKSMKSNQVEYITSLLNEYGRVLNLTRKIPDFKNRKYLLRLIYDDYIRKCDDLLNRQYNENFVTHLKNIVYAKYKNTIKL